MKLKKSISRSKYFDTLRGTFTSYLSFYFQKGDPTHHREKVRTTNFTTSKTKKNIEKVGDDHNIEKLY